MIVGIRIGNVNYYYTMENGHIGMLHTYTEMLNVINRTNILKITDEMNDDEWDATDDFHSMED